jgi:hypothetical protein
LPITRLRDHRRTPVSTHSATCRARATNQVWLSALCQASGKSARRNASNSENASNNRRLVRPMTMAMKCAQLLSRSFDPAFSRLCRVFTRVRSTL